MELGVPTFTMTLLSMSMYLDENRQMSIKVAQKWFH